MTKIYIKKDDDDYMFDFMTSEEIFHNAKPKNYIEKAFLDEALKVLGRNTTVKDLSKFLHISKSLIYQCITERKLITLKIGRKILIMTKSILNIVRVPEE